MTNIERLLVVQSHDIRIAEIEREMRDIPARKNQDLTRLDTHMQALAAADEDLKANQAEIAQLELEVETSQGKITKFREQQLEIKTNKEFKAMEMEIKSVADKIQGFEDDTLELMETYESIKADVAQRQKDLAAERVAVDEDVRVLDERLSGLEAELKRTIDERNLSAEGIDPEWIQHYDTIRTRRVESIVKLKDGICSGCHMQLPPSAVHAVLRHDAMTTCDYCARMLY